MYDRIKEMNRKSWPYNHCQSYEPRIILFLDTV